MRTPRADDPQIPDALSLEPVDPYEPQVGSLPRSEYSAEQMENVTKTGTTTVGLTTDEGVVIATDMRASLGGMFVANKDVQKVEQIHPTAALTLVGSVGGAQSFIRSLRAEVNLYEARRGEEMSMQALSTLAGNFARGGPFFAINPILGGVDDDGHHVYSIDPAGGVMRDEYTVTGSGMMVAHGLLEQEYESGLSNEEAKTVAARAVRSAAERDTGSGNGVFLAEVTGEGVDIRGHKDFDEVC
ncbi:archaeal proteasome endopeptidase complex subunit beta [Haloarchaeobius sp. HME9146]|uniref:archaeal proteasome endopeptidase complex subunit beta n=1 Tax=Haloarchaeobius sp. HME9146 TaxID=2978732 RepID=UPI0021C1207D|nr:archaeal proteasome endopeptidase complex subunit beta [Haloarchaeobius sp. HME9146]MCT9096784.1 archaeal proteasome endopeptidase complex subunit beta [Haloarchaeobius sp. HME9146]